MAIPAGTRFHGVHEPVKTTNKGSALSNSLRNAYTIEEMNTTYEIDAEQNGNDADFNLGKVNGQFGISSTVKFVAGDNINLSVNGDNDEITIYANANGPHYSFRTITNDYVLLVSDVVIVFDFSSQQNVDLPSAASNAGKVYIIRGEHGSDSCNLRRTGTDKVIDDGSPQNDIIINANKARTLVSDGVSNWYCVTGIGS